MASAASRIVAQVVGAAVAFVEPGERLDLVADFGVAAAGRPA